MIDYISKEIPLRWNKTAIDCFEIKCNCNKCLIKNLYFTDNNDCKMKYYVIEMYKKIGIPKK